MYRRFQGDCLVGGGLRRGGYFGKTFHRGICHGGKKIFMKGVQDFLALFTKKQWKNKYEEVFLNSGQNLSFSAKSEVLTRG